MSNNMSIADKEADLKPAGTALKDGKAEFINFLREAKKATSTIIAYAKDLDQLIEFLAGKKITQAVNVDSQMIEEFKESLANLKYTQKTISRKLNAIKSFFKFLVQTGKLDKDPAAAVAHPEVIQKPPRILSPLEYRALRDAARDDARMETIIELMLQTGIRIGEVSRMTLNDVDLTKNEMVIRAFESQLERTVPLNETAKKSLVRYLEERGSNGKTAAVFITKTGRPLLVRNIRSAIDRYFGVAGVEGAKVNDLRHTFIVHQLRNGVSLTRVAELVGHRRVSTTERYLEMIDGGEAKEKKAEPEEL